MPDTAYIKFLEFYVQPKSDRIKNGLPATIDDFCTIHNIDRSIIGGYVAKPEFFDDLQKFSINWAKGKTPSILQKYYKKVMESLKAEDIREWRQLVYESEKSDKTGGSTYIQNNFIKVDDNQYQQIIARESKRLGAGSTELAS